MKTISHPIVVVPLALILSASMAFPAVNLSEAARIAGAATAARIFQSAEELRNICYADAERELQECQETGRENCAGVYEQDRRVCLVRYPEPVQEGGNNQIWFWAVMSVLIAVVWAAYEGEATNDAL